MKRWLPLMTGVVLLALTNPVWGQACGADAVQAAARRTLAMQTRLLTAKVNDMDTDVPAVLKPVLHDFKQELLATVDLALRCKNPDPAGVQNGLAALLHANLQHANVPDRPGSAQGRQERDSSSSGTYGSDLQIRVTAVPAEQGLYAIQIVSGVVCGDDAMLLLYRRTGSGWQRELAYFNPDLNTVGDAVGDFFLWSLVPGPKGSTLFAAVHGTPWCTSRMSGFHVDLLTLARGGEAQHVLGHMDHAYSRDDDVSATLKLHADGFSFRAHGDSLDFDNLYTRPRVYRFQTSGGRLERVQPVADNARDFVDVWFKEPWAEVAPWSAPELKQVHDDQGSGFETIQSFGPVRGCVDPTHFQIELEMESDHATADLEIKQMPRQYVQVRQSPGMFFILAISEKADAGCKGPDLMKRRQAVSDDLRLPAR